MEAIKKTICVLLLFLSGLAYSQSAATHTVYIFLSENCPLSQNYIGTLNKLYDAYGAKSGVEFTGVFSNYFSGKKSIREFQDKYDVKFPLIKDKDGRFRERFGATVTPEVFVVDKNALLVYAGRIDDSFYDIGKRRNETTTHDLENVLRQISSGEHLSGLTKTQAVGSAISLKKKNG